MPTFKAPQYTKVVNPVTGAQEPCYTFNIEFNDSDYISFVADNQSDISLLSLQKCILDNLEWWNTFIGQFLQASVKFFSKPYTVETINKITKHTLNGAQHTAYPINVVLVPKNIRIYGGNFIVNWGYTAEPMIDFPDVDDIKTNTIELDTLPVSNKIVEGIEELNMDDLPVGGAPTDDALELDSPAKFYDKQRVKEARLKAKLAVYKAQRQMAQYYEKYGDDISDSDTDLETSDEESEEESDEDSGVQEVQL
jgi:hypothetical protein